jgi:hypothetical protein
MGEIVKVIHVIAKADADADATDDVIGEYQ